MKPNSHATLPDQPHPDAAHFDVALEAYAVVRETMGDAASGLSIGTSPPPAPNLVRVSTPSVYRRINTDLKVR
jgi:hypothetical protein